MRIVRAPPSFLPYAILSGGRRGGHRSTDGNWLSPRSLRFAFRPDETRARSGTSSGTGSFWNEFGDWLVLERVRGLVLERVREARSGTSLGNDRDCAWLRGATIELPVHDRYGDVECASFERPR